MSKASAANSDQPKEKMSDKMKRLFGRKEQQINIKSSGDNIPESNFNIDELENKPLDKIAACDTLFEEIREFLWQAKETIDFTTKSKNSSMGAKIGLPPMGVTASVNKWRAKRKGNSLFAKYDAVQAKIEKIEGELKFITDESLMDNSTLMVQALHVKWRLKACIQYNDQATKDTTAKAQVAKELISDIRRSEKNLVSMMTFLDEVSRLQERENQVGLSRADEYVPWALRQSVEEQRAAGPLVPPLVVKRENLQRRLDRVRKLKTAAEGNVAMIAKQLEREKVNFKHCTNCMLAMNKMLRSINTPAVVQQINTSRVAAAAESTIVDSENPGVVGGTGRAEMAAVVEKRRSASEQTTVSSAVNAADDAAILTTEEVDMDRAGESKSAGADADGVAHDGPEQLSSEDQAVERAKAEHAKAMAKEAVEAAAAAALVPGKSGWDESESEDEDEEEEEEEEDVGNGIVKIVKRPLSQFMPPGALKEQLVTLEETEYDHSQCQDCALVFSMGNDCLMHLAASQHIAHESAKRLMKLMELRERVRDSANTLETYDWGEGSGSTPGKGRQRGGSADT